MSTETSTGDENEIRYSVVINDEEQYSIWPAHRETPAGWRETGCAGTKQECLDHIDTVWTDMRPRSLRERMTAKEA
ncbi:MbtH family protein [Streptomyces axinellae]|uniref:MbtH family NRPS accessory protein n=1 Tax=Streptomyces axinellae TaxID=552788 RepID=A0ABP6CFX1_9ACTN